MARMTTQEQEKKLQQAKELYISGFAIPFVADTVSVKSETLRKWIDTHQWDNLRRAKLITPSEIQNAILQTFAELKEGKDPKISADKISKLASAYEKLSDRQVAIGYMIDSFSELQKFILSKAQSALIKSKKEKYIHLAQEVQAVTEELLQQKFKALHHE